LLLSELRRDRLESPRAPGPRRRWRGIIVAAALCAQLFVGVALVIATGDSPWRELEEGLALGEFEAPQKAESGNSRITVLRIDPRFYAFHLLSASEHGKERLTVKEWSQQHLLVAAVNAGMYQQDGFTSVGYMKNFGHLNNRRLSRENAVLAFNPTDPSLPEIQLVDRECQDFNSLKGKYQTMIQGIRMISCDQRNVWSQQPEKWSTVAVGMDKSGRVLFLFTRSPYSVHDFIEILLALPLSIQNAMYLEGGPQAALYVAAGHSEIEMHGSLETGFNDTDAIQLAFPIPNVLGVVRKPKR
jgi:hypothetical protein